MDDWFERSPVVGFVPWIVYWVVADGPSTWLVGAVCAVLATLIMGMSAGFGGLRLLDYVTVVFFAAITVLGLVVGAHDRDRMDDYATTLSSGVLAAMALASLARQPFTAQYAPVSASRPAAEEEAFRRTNQVLTLMWALVFALIAALGAVGVAAPGSVYWTKAVVPVVVLVGAAAMTQAYPRKARQRARQAAG